MTHVKRTLLHVDDDPAITRMVAARLKPLGLETVAVHDPREALDRLVREGFRCVLCDIDMPHLNGMELLRKIKEFDGGLQVTMLTGMVAMSTVMQTHRWGAESCFFKPIDDYQALADALHASFTKIERWWKTLEQLSLSRRGQSPAAPAAAAGATAASPAVATLPSAN